MAEHRPDVADDGRSLLPGQRAHIPFPEEGIASFRRAGEQQVFRQRKANLAEQKQHIAAREH